MTPLAILTWLADHTYVAVWRAFQLGRRERMIAEQTRRLEEERRRHAVLFAADEERRRDPSHGVALVAEDTWADWRGDDLIEFTFGVTIRNGWIYPLTLRTLGGAIIFQTGRQGQEFAPEIREVTVPALQAAHVRRPYRWRPSEDPPAAPLDAARTSVVDVQLQVFAYFGGEYGDFALKDVVLPLRLLIPARGGTGPSL